MTCHPVFSFFFFFNDTATTEIYTLSLHDALPISRSCLACKRRGIDDPRCPGDGASGGRHRGGDRLSSQGGPAGFLAQDRKSTRLNSSHGYISYAVFCLKKKKT